MASKPVSFKKELLLKASNANKISSFGLTSTPNWSEFEINEYTPKFAGCLSVPAGGSDEEIIKCSRKCTIAIFNKGLAIIDASSFVA